MTLKLSSKGQVVIPSSVRKKYKMAAHSRLELVDLAGEIVLVLMPSPRYLLDTSALICYLAEEKEAGEVAKVKTASSIPFIALTELYYLLWEKRGKAEADNIYGLVRSWRLPTVFPNERILLTAGRIKAQHGLGIADSYIAACAHETGETLLTKDNDYRSLQKEIAIQFL
ncbi:MAG: PIN domain-containing protein [Candidatus Omnitrophica bacterium]|nr:PIN domain-containing protein [Candidatus Omnitrophota bacterium]